jgi:hypothetical protein
MIGDYPLLYKQVDGAINNGNTFGASLSDELFDVDVNLQINDKMVRGFTYSDCRITDYSVATQKGNEEGFFFWFALDNTFEFECAGYNPINPSYDIMSESKKPEQNNNKYWENTQRWADEFRYIPRDKSN